MRMDTDSYDEALEPRRAEEGWHEAAEERDVRIPGVLPDLGQSIIRTVVPVVVGWVLAGLTGLAEWAGTVVPAGAEEAVTAAVVTVVTVVYYAVARLLELAGSRLPLLGSRRTPSYE